MENEGSSQVKSIEKIIVLNETVGKTVDLQVCSYKHNIYSNSDDEESTVLPLISKPNTSSLLNTKGIIACTMTLYEVLHQSSRAVYRATYLKDSENYAQSTWKCSKRQHNSTATCPAALTVLMKQEMITVLDIGRHKCRNPPLSVQKRMIGGPSSSSHAWPGKVYRGKTLQSSKISLANTMANMTVEDININPNIPLNLPAIVYTGRSLEQVETIIRQDKRKMQQFYNRVEILYVSGTVYDLDPMDAAAVLREKHNLNFVYYNGKTYRKYSQSFNELGHVNTQYRCNGAVDCVSELRLSQDTSDTAYALRFEHHTCKPWDIKKNSIGVINDLEKFYSSVNSKYCNWEPSSRKPLVYFHGYVYEYLNHMCDHHSSSKNVCKQHKYKCRWSAINNCLAILLFCNIREYKHVLKVGNHTCNCTRTLLEVDIDDKNMETIADSNGSKIENNISFSSSDCNEIMDECDIKKLLERSIEKNQEINCLTANLKGNFYDLDKKNHNSETSDSTNSCVEECSEFFARTEGDHNLDKHREKMHDDEKSVTFGPREKNQEADNTSTHISETETLEIARENKKGIGTQEKSLQLTTITELNGSSEIQAIETSEEITNDVKKVLVTEEQSQNLSSIIEAHSFCNIEAMKKKLEVENFHVDNIGENVGDKAPIPSSSYELLDGQMNLQQVLPKHNEMHSNSSSLMKKKLEVENFNMDTTGKNVKDKTPLPSSFYDNLDSQMNIQQVPIHTKTDSNNSTLMFLVDHVTNERRYTWHPSTSVKVKYLGYIFGDMPPVDPNDSSTVYLMYSYNNRANKKILHYMGYNYYRARSKTRYRCEATHFCTAWLNMKDKKVSVFGQHTCRSLIGINSSTKIHTSKNSCNAGELTHVGAIPSSTITSLEETQIKSKVENYYPDNDNTLKLASSLEFTQEFALFGQITCISSMSLNPSTTEIHDSENSCNAVAGELIQSDPIPSSNITALEEIYTNAEVVNYEEYDNSLQLAPSLKSTQEDGIEMAKIYGAKTEFEIKCEEDPGASNVEDISFVTEEPKSEVNVQAFTDITLDVDKQNDIVAVDSALDICQEYMTNNTNSVNEKEESNGDVQDQFNDDTISSHLNSLMDLKKEDHIDIMEHRIDRIGMKIEAEETPVTISDKEICCVKEEGPDNNQDIIDITLDDSEEDIVDNMSDNLYDSMWNETDTCEVTTSNSSNLVNYDNVLLAYNGYEYHKEQSGKFAWCKESKICSGMIKILPNNKGEIIGRHTCKGIREIRDGVLEVYDIDPVNNSNEKAVKIKTLTSDPREMKLVPVKNQHDYQESASGKRIQFCGYQYEKHRETGDIFTCIHKNSCYCPGMLHMLRDKIVRRCDHLCTDVKNLTSSVAENKRSTVLIYPNKLTANPEAMYKGFTYQRTLRTSHVSAWECTAASCTAVIKIYTFTTTLSEVGAHACTPKDVRDISIKNKAIPVKVVKSIPIQKTNKKARKKSALPVFENKAIIPVFNDMGEINLIYQGNIYRGGGANWACIHLDLKGCKGFLRILKGAVMYVTKHDCFDKSFTSTTSLQNKYTNYYDFLTSVPTVINNSSPKESRTENLRVFQGRKKKNFALYEGYVYKKSQVSSNGKVCKWICMNHIVHHCEGVLTTNSYTVLATSQHRCLRDELNQVSDRGLLLNNTKRRISEPMRVDTTSSGSTRSNRKDKKRIVNTKRKACLTEETVSAKRFRRYENTRKSEGYKSSCAEQDIETPIPPTNNIELVKTLRSGNQTIEIYKKRSGKDVHKYGQLENREVFQYDANKPIELDSESETEEDVEVVKEKFICNEANDSSALICENYDSKLSVLPVKEEIVDIQCEMEFVEINCQDDNNDLQSELVSEAVDYDRLLSSIKEENFDSDFGGEGTISKVKEVEDIDAENVSMALSRGPNGEYFVHVNNVTDT